LKRSQGSHNSYLDCDSGCDSGGCCVHQNGSDTLVCAVVQSPAANYAALAHASWSEMQCDFTVPLFLAGNVELAKNVGLSREWFMLPYSIAARTLWQNAFANLEKLGHTRHAIACAGYRGDELVQAGYMSEELKMAGHTAAALKKSGVSLAKLKDVGFTASDLRDSGVSFADLKSMGYTAADLLACGASVFALKKLGYTAADFIACACTGGRDEQKSVDRTPPIKASFEETSAFERESSQGSQGSTVIGVESGEDSDSSSCSSLPPSKPAHDTLIILDWDDTMVPTTWLQNQGLLADGSEPDREQRMDLGKATRYVERTLRKARQLGTVVVITNADVGWVHLSCRRYLPSLIPLMEGVKVLSARSTYEPWGVSSPLEWKCLAFDEVIAPFPAAAKTIDGKSKRCVVSVGDSKHERAALRHNTQGLADCQAKSVKFIQKPSLLQLVYQHDILSDMLKEVVEYEGNLDLSMPQQPIQKSEISLQRFNISTTKLDVDVPIISSA